MDDVKMVIVVRKDLHMRKGKMCAQAAHASMAVLLDKMSIRHHQYDQGDGTPYGREEWILDVYTDSPMWEWLHGSFVKIVVYVNSLEEMIELQTEARNLTIPTALITDAGRTEFHGEPTVTALAIGPDYSEKIDKITGDLPLL